MNDALHSSPNPVLTLRPYLQLSASSKEPLELQTFNGPRCGIVTLFNLGPLNYH